MDANLRPRLWTQEALAIVDPRALLAEVDLLKVSEDDLRVLGATNPESLQTNLRRGAILVSTNGPRPTRALGPFGEVFADVSPLDVKSAIGAGDAFVAGLLSILAKASAPIVGAETIKGALDRGNAAAHEALLARSSPSK
jgi:sugar/nucleoside kinase (ribokinase family)